MKTLVIILAQGQQTRLPELPISKTMLPLFVRDSDGVDEYPYAPVTYTDLQPNVLSTPRATLAPRVTIMERTIAQLGHMWSRRDIDWLAVRVVASDQTMGEMLPMAWTGGAPYIRAPIVRGRGSPAGKWSRWITTTPSIGDVRGLGVSGLSFESPRNSSLRGIADTLSALDADGDLPSDRKGLDLQIVVLFGDTIYSWACLREILRCGRECGHTFTVSPDLSRSEGEVWGLSWCNRDDLLMTRALADALRKHPPVNDTYQAGQMRRWLFELCDGDLDEMAEHASCVPNGECPDDYTRDIDLPGHVNLLPQLASQALIDDERNGLFYGVDRRNH